MSENVGVRIITRRLHGSHAVVDQAKDLQSALQEGARPLSEDVQDSALRDATGEAALESTGATDFDYLFPDLLGEANLLPPDTARVTPALDAVGAAMIDQGDSGRNAPIPPIHTYWGQFVDHDLTAATDNDSPISIQGDSVTVVAPDEVKNQLKNGRNPALNLDSVYGNGPFAPPRQTPKEIVVPYQETDKAKLKLGRLSQTGGSVGVLIPPVGDLERDLPRVEVAEPEGSELGTPLIGDGRNDENLAVAQLHVAFLRFHNNVVDWVRTHEPERTGVSAVFNRARQLVQWTYQWICVHDYLTSVLTPGTVDQVLASDNGLLKRPFMPLEFSVAAFRFGHSMVRGAYDWNRNFGLGEFFQPEAGLDALFRFTGRGGMAGDPTKLPDNWPAEYDRLVRLDPAFPKRFARPIDTHLADPLKGMVNQVPDTDPPPSQKVADLLKHLARRNLRRGYALSIPTGQAVAGKLDLPVLGEQDFADALDQTLFDALKEGGFLTATPLWLYVLAESQIVSSGHALGPVGSRIVAETIIGQIRHDPRSYLNQTSWTPAAGVKLPDGSAVTSIAKFIQFAGFPV